ncbi:MAG: MFS transporter [Victivallaceae bacterium]
MFDLLMRRRFGPLFVTQFFGAFNDNFLKCAILTLVTFKMATDSASAAMYTNLALALFILPFFLFSALAGEINDKFDKARCCRVVKLIEIVLMILTAAAFWLGSIPLLLGLLFCMGAQSTFFGPAKYALLPQQLRDDELLTGNALIEGGTFLAILIGSIGGSIVLAFSGGLVYASATLVLLAAIGYGASRFIPVAPPLREGLKIHWNIPLETVLIVKYAFAVPVLRHCILALSAFWLAGSLYVSQLPGLCRDVLGADETVNTVFLTTFSIGIAIGSLGAAKILKGKVSGSLAWIGVLGMLAFTVDLYFASRGRAVGGGELRNLIYFLNEVSFWRISFDLLAIAIAGGIFSVPLQAMMQHHSPSDGVGRVIAANNITNSLFMAGGAAAVAFCVKCFSLVSADVMLIIAAIHLANTAYVIKIAKFR